MTAMEISLLVIGGIAFIASFIVPEIKKESTKEDVTVDTDAVKRIIEEQMGDVHKRLQDVVDETVDYAVEKTERTLDKLSNEKIMAVNEYSDTVLEEINKNHKEVMFLYDMLSDKQVDLKNTVRKAEQTKKDAKEIVEAVEEKIAEPFVAGLGERKVDKKKAKVIEPAQPKEIDVQINFEAGDDSGKNKNDRILNLHAAGKSNVAIAKELGLGVGEVKLVIDLFEGANG